MSDGAGATAIILVGGKGTRLAEVVSDRPKPLANVGGRPFVTRLFDQLLDANVYSVILCTGHRGEQARHELGPRYGRAELRYSHESEPLGTGGAARLAAERVGTDTTIVMNGDAYCGVRVADVLAGHGEAGATATVVVTHVSDTSRYGRVDVDEDGCVAAFREKQPGAGAGWINAGIYVVATPRLLDVPAGRAVSLEREVFPAWVGDKLRAHTCVAPFLDIGTPESYAAAEEFFRIHGHDNLRDVET